MRLREQVLKVAATLAVHAPRITVYFGNAADNESLSAASSLTSRQLAVRDHAQFLHPGQNTDSPQWPRQLSTRHDHSPI